MKKFFASFITSIMILITITPAFATAQSIIFADNTATKNVVCQGIGASSTANGCKSSNGVDITNVMNAALQILSFIAGIAAVIMIIVSGIRYTTSGGDSAGISGAKSGIIYAIVGLVVVAMAQVIVHFVLNRVTKK